LISGWGCSSSLVHRRPLPQFKLILQWVEDTGLLVIFRSILDLMRVGSDEANHRMWEAYLFGKTQLFVTHLERAELVVEQFAHRGLSVRIEPA
jgi:hypothetical protein